LCLFFLSFMFGGSSVWTQCHVFPTQWSTTSATPPDLLGFRYFIQIGSYFWLGWVLHWDTPTDTSNAAEILDTSQHAYLICWNVFLLKINVIVIILVTSFFTFVFCLSFYSI
jgi:hypothetical protein